MNLKERFFLLLFVCFVLLSSSSSQSISILREDDESLYPEDEIDSLLNKNFENYLREDDLTAVLRPYLFPGVAMTGAKAESFFRIGNPSRPIKIYVYDLPARFNVDHLPEQKRNKTCFKSMYYPDIFLHEYFLSSPFITSEPEEADIFLAPVYLTCHLFNVWKMTEAKDFFEEAVNYISNTMPYFERNKGSDHLWIFSYDTGLKALHEETRNSIKNGIILTIGGSLEDDFYIPQREIVIPPFIREERRIEYFKTNCSHYSEAPYVLALLRGVFNLPKNVSEIYDVPKKRMYSRGVRQYLFDKYRNDSEIIIRRGHTKEYICEMRHAEFAICPPGFVPWTPRVFESMMAESIPLIISDFVSLPFEDVIDYSSFSVKILENDVTKLKEKLQKVSQEDREKKRKNLVKYRDSFMYFSPPRPGDATHNILERIALKVPGNRIAFKRTWI